MVFTLVDTVELNKLRLHMDTIASPSMDKKVDRRLQPLRRFVRSFMSRVAKGKQENTRLRDSVH